MTLVLHSHVWLRPPSEPRRLRAQARGLAADEDLTLVTPDDELAPYGARLLRA